MLCVGTQTVFIDNANEQHNMILLKHFTEKNHAAVVDIKTRKRKTGWCRSSMPSASPVLRNKQRINLLCSFPFNSEGLPTHPVSGFHNSRPPGAAGGPVLPKDPDQPLPEQFHLHH